MSAADIKAEIRDLYITGAKQVCGFGRIWCSLGGFLESQVCRLRARELTIVSIMHANITTHRNTMTNPVSRRCKWGAISCYSLALHFAIVFGQTVCCHHDPIEWSAHGPSRGVRGDMFLLPLYILQVTRCFGVTRCPLSTRWMSGVARRPSSSSYRTAC